MVEIGQAGVNGCRYIINARAIARGDETKVVMCRCFAPDGISCPLHADLVRIIDGVAVTEVPMNGEGT